MNVMESFIIAVSICQKISGTLSIWKAGSSFQTLIVYDIEISRKQMWNCS